MGSHLRVLLHDDTATICVIWRYPKSFFLLPIMIASLSYGEEVNRVMVYRCKFIFPEQICFGALE
jgi:hypothetical protein